MFIQRSIAYGPVLAVLGAVLLAGQGLSLAIVGADDPATSEGNTDLVGVPDLVMRAPGRPGGFPFVNFYENESVSISSGGLFVAHPSSPLYPLNGGSRLGLARFYSSKICREDVYTRDWVDGNNQVHHQTVHVWRGKSWAGYGWSFHLGRISYVSEKADPNNQVDFTNVFHFVEPDGTDHRLYGVASNDYGTADGSYIRAVEDPNEVFKVYYPDGRWLRLEKISDPNTVNIGPQQRDHIVTNPEAHGWYTVEAGRGTHSFYQVAYQRGDGYGYPEGIRSIQDNVGREIDFGIYVDPNRDPNQPAVDPNLYGTLKQISSPAFGGNHAIYKFRYDLFATDPNRAGNTVLPLLRQADLPEGYEISYEYGTVALAPLLTRVTHPSGSYTDYLYRTDSVYSRGTSTTGSAVGVSRRHVNDGLGRSFSWFFGRATLSGSDQVTVTDPYGDVTEYLLYADPNMPFNGRASQVTVHQGSLQGPIVSQIVTDTMLACSSSPKVVNYGQGTVIEADVRPFRVEKRLFNPGDPNYVATAIQESTDWNGLGQFYSARVSGTGVKGIRETFTKWTADPNVTDPNSWLLHLFSYQDVVDNGMRSRASLTFDGEGRIAERRTYRNIDGVDLDGSLSISRICAECGRPGCPPCPPDPWVPPPRPVSCGVAPTFPVPADPNGPVLDDQRDPIVTYTYDATSGNLSQDVRRFQTTDSTPNWNDPVQQNYQYENGSVSRVTVAGVAFNLQSADVDLTGLPSSTIDSSGVRVSSIYDTLGRVKSITPVSDTEDSTRYIYAPGAGPTHFSEIIRGGNGSDTFEPASSNQLYAKESYDGLGRTARVENAMPGGQLSVQETAYAPTGQAVFVSEWIRDVDLASAQRVTYSRAQTDPNSDPNVPDDEWNISLPVDPNGHIWGTRVFYGEPSASDPENPLAVSWDPAGRAHQEVAVDGTKSTATYNALSRMVTVKGAKVLAQGSALGDPNTVDVSTIYWEDGLGRLLMVDSPQSADALYGYDVLGRLTAVNLVSQLPATNTWDAYGTIVNDPNGQQRSFLYDGVGQLVESASPESGTVRNELFNAVGQPGTMQDERGRSRGYHFELKYDSLGRPTSSQRAADSWVTTGYLLNEGFSSGIPAGWSRMTDPNSDPNAFTWHAYPSLSGENCHLTSNPAGMVRVGGSPCGYGGALYGKDQLVSPPLGTDLGNTYTAPISGMTVLTFRYWRDVRNTSRDANPQRLDRTYVEVEDITAGGSLTRVFYLDSTSTAPGKWQTSPEIDLSGFKDHVIRLHFVFERTDQGDNTPRAGWVLDWVTVQTKTTDLQWEEFYDQSYCSTSGIFFYDLCWGDTALTERPLGKLSEIKSYQEGALLSDKYLLYQGPNGRLSSWLERLYRPGIFGPEDFVARLRYDSLGELIGLRAPQRTNEAARDYSRFYDRGMIVRLGEMPDSAEYLATVEHNPGGGIYRIVFPTGVTETVDYDESYRPNRIRINSLVPPSLGGDDFNNGSHGQPPPRQVVLDTGTYHYDGVGNIMAMGGDAFIYDGAMRLKGASVKGHEVDYSYDVFGNMTDVQMPFEPTPIPEMVFASRSYTSASSSPPVADNRIHDPNFHYDENGNLTEEPAHGSEPSKRYVFDANNHLKEVWSNSPEGFHTLSRSSYDAAGMRVAKEDFTKAGRITYYLRDPGGEVLSEYVVERGPFEAAYRSKEYLTGLNRPLGVNTFCGPPPKLSITDLNPDGGSFSFSIKIPPALEGITGYQLDIAAVGFHQLLSVYPDPNGHFQVPETSFSADYTSYVRIRALASCGESVWSNEVQAMTWTSTETPFQPVREFDTAEPSFFHVDHLGSVRVETDHSGYMTARRDYYPFGQEMSPIGSGENTHRFAGHERDLETGMDYMLARYYASWQGRFLSQDPVSGFMSDGQSWNRGAYVLSSPLNYQDPTGNVVVYFDGDDTGGGWGGGFFGDGGFFGGWDGTFLGDGGGDVCTPPTCYYTPVWAFAPPQLPTDPVREGPAWSYRDPRQPGGGGASSGRENLKGPSEASSCDVDLTCVGQCIQANRLDWGAVTDYTIGNPLLNLVAGDTGRSGLGGPAHATSWQHKLGAYVSRLTGNPAFSRAGKFVGRASLVPTVFEGFYDIGTIGRCAAVCGGC